MAYTDSIFTAAQVQMSELFSEPELRAALRPVNTILLKNAPALFINLQDIVDSEGVQTDAFYFKRTTAAVTNARTSDHAGGVGTSAHDAISFTPYVRNFSHSTKDSMHNVLGADFLANEIYNAFQDIMIDIETDSLAFLETNKSGVNDYGGQFGTFDAADDILDIPYVYKDKFFNITKQVMRSNDYRKPLDIIYSTDGNIIFQEQAAQGPGNEKNLVYQMAGINFEGVSDLFSIDNDELLQMYAWERGAAAMVSRIPKLNAMGKATPVADYFNLPNLLGSGMTFAVHAYWVKADGGNKTQDVVRRYQLSVDIARSVAPLSNSGEKVIQKFSLLTENI